MPLSYETVGLTTALNRPLIMGKDLLHMSGLVFGTRTGCRTLAIFCQHCTSWQHAARLMREPRRGPST